MMVKAQVVAKAPSSEIRAGESRVLLVTGIGGDDTFVFLDADDNVRRVHRRGQDSTVVPWALEQVLRDVLDPHAVAVG